MNKLLKYNTQVPPQSSAPWIIVSQVGKYPQGDITEELFNRIVANYNKELIGTPFIPEHRSFNENGEMKNNLRALAWVENVSTDGNFLYVQPEATADLEWYYDGTSFRYASIEIETVEIEGKKEPYLAAIAVTNFPAAKIPKIALQYSKEAKGTVLYGNVIKMNSKNNNTNSEETMKKEQIEQLTKELGLDDKATPEQIIEKVKQLNQQKPPATNSVQPAQTTQPNDAILARLTALENQNASYASRDLEATIDAEIAAKKFLPSQKEDLLKAYAGKLAEFQAFAAKQPTIALSAQMPTPKENEPNALSYKKLLADPTLYQKTKDENPSLFDQLRQAWIANPDKE